MLKNGLTYLVNLSFCLTLVNQSYFFPFHNLVFIYRLQITKFYMSFFSLSSGCFNKVALSSIHSDFKHFDLFKKGLFIEKNYFEQYTGLVEIGYFTTSDSTISICHMAGLCRRPLLSSLKVPCVLS